jgi:hypothetical protein
MSNEQNQHDPVDRIFRNQVVQLLGTPNHTDGSLNDPVEKYENGHQYNERWTYSHLRDDPSGTPMRLIYWHRYDFVGTMVRESADQPWRADDTLAVAVKERADRLALVNNRNPSLPDNQRYHPASNARDAHDLGGYIEGEKR